MRRVFRVYVRTAIMLFVLIKRLSQLATWIVTGGRKSAAAPCAIEPTAHAVAPAVAGFEQRLEPELELRPLLAPRAQRPVDFQLAARLASVAHLNTRAGRVPNSRQRPNAQAKVMPKLVNHAPKRSAITTQKPRIASRPVVAVQAENVTQLQLESRCIPLEVRIARAA